MNFIKKVFEGDVDESVHLQFQKFSKGEFRNRALINVKKTGGKCNLSTSVEFANELVKEAAKKLGENKTNVKGAVVSTNDLTGELDFQDKKQFQGVKRYLIDKEMSGNEIIELMDKFPKAFFALSFEAGDTKLKIKPKAPKSAKPKNKEDAPKSDFCSLKTSDEKIAKSFVFEKPDFKTANITHHFIIERIETPEELKNSEDFVKIREESKRAGKIIREAVIDGQKIKSEKEFEV